MLDKVLTFSYKSVIICKLIVPCEIEIHYKEGTDDCKTIGRLGLNRDACIIAKEGAAKTHRSVAKESMLIPPTPKYDVFKPNITMQKLPGSLLVDIHSIMQLDDPCKCEYTTVRKKLAIVSLVYACYGYQLYDAPVSLYQTGFENSFRCGAIVNFSETEFDREIKERQNNGNNISITEQSQKEFEKQSKENLEKFKDAKINGILSNSNGYEQITISDINKVNAALLLAMKGITKQNLGERIINPFLDMLTNGNVNTIINSDGIIELGKVNTLWQHGGKNANDFLSRLVSLMKA